MAKKRQEQRTIRVKGEATAGPGTRKPRKTADKPVSDKPVVKRKTDAEKAAIAAEKAAEREKIQAENQARQDAMEEAYHPKLGYHIPMWYSTKPVVNPKTMEMYIPLTGEVLPGKFGGTLPPKIGSVEKTAQQDSLKHMDEDHPWIPVYGASGRLARSPQIKNIRNHWGGMNNWAHMLKNYQDPDNEYEFKVWRAEPPKDGDYRGLPYTVKDVTPSKRYTWHISKRKRYCEKCAPTITLPNGSVKPNPAKTVERPPMNELASKTNMVNTTMDDVIQLDIASAGGRTGRSKQRKNWLEAFGIDQNKTAE